MGVTPNHQNTFFRHFSMEFGWTDRFPLFSWLTSPTTMLPGTSPPRRQCAGDCKENEGVPESPPSPIIYHGPWGGGQAAPAPALAQAQALGWVPPPPPAVVATHQWFCPACHMLNNEKDPCCDICETPRVVAAPAALTSPAPVAVAVATTKAGTKRPAGEWQTTGRQQGVAYLKISAPPWCATGNTPEGSALDCSVFADAKHSVPPAPRDTMSRRQVLERYAITPEGLDSIPSTDEYHYGRHYQSVKVADIERYFGM